jgi:hypothetical protein
MNIRLSKSTFLKGLQCEKALYLLKHYPELRDEISPQQQAIFDQGTDVGDLARNLFPGGINPSTSLPRDYNKCIADTQKLIDNGTEVIYEAGFLYDDVHCFMDILVKKEDGWHAFEVKSSTGVHDVYYRDAAIQYYVLSGTGLDLASISIVHINNQYVRNGDIDVHQLFNAVDVTAEVIDLQDEVKAKLIQFKAMLARDREPVIDIGPHCSNPYPCDFGGHCWKHIPEYSIFDIANMRGDKKWKLYERGILTLEDIPEDAPLSSKEWQQVKAELDHSTSIDKPGIRSFLADLKYPLYYLDFESMNPAVPLFDNSRPYQQICFQYSLHIQENPGGETIHREFLADADGDPRIPFIEQLIKDLEGEGNVLVYHQAFEIPRLKEIARDFPQYAIEIEDIINRIVDLIIPFRSRQYYVPELKGSYSIKDVLPALVPGFSYDGLEIADGGTASIAFRSLYSEKDAEKVNAVRENLLEYCKMDTLAMVEIMGVLEKV